MRLTCGVSRASCCEWPIILIHGLATTPCIYHPYMNKPFENLKRIGRVLADMCIISAFIHPCTYNIHITI